MSLVETFVEVTLPNPENFLKVRETLTRIGVSSKTENRLFQSCHILHKKGKYYICHFKELFALDGLADSVPESDIARRNTIANLLAEWKLVQIVDPIKTKDPVVPINYLKILPFSEKNGWELVPKYNIGRKKNT
jgi:Bacteriophage translational regulator